MITILGLDDSGELTSRQQTLVDNAQLLCGGERHLAFFPDFPNDTRVIKGGLAEFAGELGKRLGDSVVVLASGDPMFYGIGGYLVKKLGAEHVTIEPAPSAMQQAFAAAKLSWQDAALTSVHGKPLTNLDGPCAHHDLVGTFTDATHSPAAIAAHCTDKGYGPFDMWVCQDLGGTQQALWQGPMEEAASQNFSDLNVVILRRRKGEAPAPLDPTTLPVFGLDDGLFVYRAPSQGLITKKEVRVVSLAQLKLRPDHIVWDVGAGSGSVTVECARLVPQGHVHAIEKNAADFALISTNLERFGVTNATLTNATAPEGLESWPTPDAVFVGGASKALDDVVRIASGKQSVGGRFVINTVTIESQAAAHQALKDHGYDVTLQLVQVSRSKPVAHLTRFDALNPITILTGVKR